MCNKPFDASRREDHDADKSELLQVLSEKLFKKNYQQATYIFNFGSFCLLQAKPTSVESEGRHQKKTLRELSNAFFRSAVALSFPEL